MTRSRSAVGTVAEAVSLPRPSDDHGCDRQPSPRALLIKRAFVTPEFERAIRPLLGTETFNVAGPAAAPAGQRPRTVGDIGAAPGDSAQAQRHRHVDHEQDYAAVSSGSTKARSAGRP